MQLYDGRYVVPEHAAIRSVSCQARQAAAGAASGLRDAAAYLAAALLQLALANPGVTALLLLTVGVAGAYHVRQRSRAITAALADAMVARARDAASRGGAVFAPQALDNEVVELLALQLVASSTRLRELLGAAREEVLRSGRLMLQRDAAGNEWWVIPGAGTYNGHAPHVQHVGGVPPSHNGSGNGSGHGGSGGAGMYSPPAMRPGSAAAYATPLARNPASLPNSAASPVPVHQTQAAPGGAAPHFYGHAAPVAVPLGAAPQLGVPSAPPADTMPGFYAAHYPYASAPAFAPVAQPFSPYR